MRKKGKADSSFLNGSLDYLREVDSLKEIPFIKCKCFLHNKHRWVLPLIYYAQEEKRLSKPCALIMFDGHHDARRSRTVLAKVRRIKRVELSIEKILGLCVDREGLSTGDDHWVRTGMELGLIRDAVIFGVRQRDGCLTLPKFFDYQGKQHRIEFLGLPYVELSNGGVLSDKANMKTHSKLWAILDWRYDPETKGFGFAKVSKRIWLDIDLDCFLTYREGRSLQWDDKVWEEEFLTFSGNLDTFGWTRKRFFDELVNRTDLITIAKEPSYCGGEEKANQILVKMNHYLFDDNLQIE